MGNTHIGKTFYISAALPATNDAAGFEALSWTRVTGYQSGLRLGLTHANIAEPNLEEGIDVGLKGMGTGSRSTLAFRRVASDTGQALVETTCADLDGLVSVKIGKGTGASGALATGDRVEYAQGYLSDFMTVEASPTTSEGYTAIFQQNAATVTATEPS